MAVTIPPIPELTTVTSETLQAKIREILPSQMGFGTDLIAQNVIVPIVDLTAAAEGSTVGENLQTAIAFGSQTAFSSNNNTVTVANTAGFWRIFGTATMQSTGSSASNAQFSMTDGLSTKIVWQQTILLTTNIHNTSSVFDFIAYLNSGESISASTANTSCFLQGSARQIADSVGNLINPSGFTPQ